MHTVVFRSVVLLEAHLVRSLLVHYGVPARVRGEHLVGLGIGIGFADGQAEVCVRSGDADEARRLIAGVRTGPDGALDDAALDDILGAVQGPRVERCPHCDAEWEPGFEICWSCEREPR